MPRYHYKCNKCDKKYENNLPLKDYDKPQKCEVCGSEMNRVFYPPNIIPGALNRDRLPKGK